jgi:Cu-Zn family superoxide dismutase
MQQGSISTIFGCGFLSLSLAALLSCGDGTRGTGSNTDSTSSASNGAGSGNAIANLSATYPDTTVDGTVRFETESDGEVKMTLDLTIPAKANQTVAVHIHEHGDCGDTAHMAGGHWNPTNAQHGKWGSSAFHLGDIGNVSLDASGKGHMELETRLWSIGGDAQKDILNKSIIVHGGTDDYTSQPSGNAGTRIACGPITRS